MGMHTFNTSLKYCREVYGITGKLRKQNKEALDAILMSEMVHGPESTRHDRELLSISDRYLCALELVTHDAYHRTYCLFKELRPHQQFRIARKALGEFGFSAPRLTGRSWAAQRLVIQKLIEQ